MPFGQDSLGLLDHDPAVQRGLQLRGDKLLLADRSLLQYPDGGHIYQRPGRPRHRRVQAIRCPAEQVQGPDDLVAQPHRDGMHGGESHLERGGAKPRPPRGHIAGADIAGEDGLPAAEAVHAWAFIVLKLKQLRHPGLLGGRCHQPQRAAAIGQKQPRRVYLQQLHAPFGERMQELHQVKAGHQGVRQFHERLRQPLVDRCHHSPELRALAAARPSVLPRLTLSQRREPGAAPGPKRSRRPTTSPATSPSAAPLANACARSRTNASSRLTPSCTEIIPVA